MPLTKRQLLDVYETMLLIRKSELKMIELFKKGEIAGHMLPCVGQEAIPATMAQIYDDRDYLVTAHRGGGHFIARGGNFQALWAELYGRVTGVTKGRGGQIHLMDIDRHALTGNAIVGTHWGLAAGAGFVARKKKAVVIAVGGEGSTNRGTFHESLNMATVQRLPILYIVEYNDKQMWNHSVETTAGTRIADRAKAYGIPGVTVDGNDVAAIHDVASRLYNGIKEGSGPCLLECITCKWTDSVSNVRAPAEELEHAKRPDVDPLARLETRLRSEGFLNDALAAEIAGRTDDQLAAALLFARSSPKPPIDDGIDEVYSMPV